MLNQRGGYRRGWRTGRLMLFTLSLLISAGLIAGSQTGLLAPLEALVATPLNAVSGVVNRFTNNLSAGVEDLAEIRSLQQRVAELEEALAQYQSELVELREIESDYGRLIDLLDYTSAADAQEFVTADVIARDQNSLFRSITINRGTRNGVAVGMPVVTRAGLVGRVTQVSANASRVMLVTDPSSWVSARLQISRAEGSVQGQLAGTLLLTLVPTGQAITEGDLVLTSGLGGNFPPDIVIGQITSVSDIEFALYQEAQVRSLINFDTLEFVLVVTNFQPVDLSVFEQAEDDG
ncbi:MAG: rod shape-determining protein MreC [Chloroflexi bacterium]|nr:rod shape-determining protein MreC [Chloroflexota bacterium]